MPRRLEFIVPCDTSLFTPLQLQPQALLRIAMSGWARWTRAYLHSFRTLLREHYFGAVVVGIHIEYLEALGFFDGDFIKASATVRLRKGGAMLDLDVDVSGVDREAAHVRLTLMPLRVGDADALSSTPAPVSQKLRARFLADEVDEAPPDRLVPPLLTQCRGGALLSEGETRFQVHRHMCEVADQWSFIEVPSLVSAGREVLVMQKGQGHGPQGAALRQGLSRPLRTFDAELRRPFFAFDDGAVRTRAYEGRMGVAFIHELRSPRSDEPHGSVIERF